MLFEVLFGVESELCCVGAAPSAFGVAGFASAKYLGTGTQFTLCALVIVVNLDLAGPCLARPFFGASLNAFDNII